MPRIHRSVPRNACERSSLRKRRLARVANFSPAVCCVQTAWTHLPREPQPRGHASVTKSRMQVSPFQFPAGHPRACPQHTHTHAPACLRARMLAHDRCAGVQPAGAGLQPPDRVRWLACCTHTLYPCTHICSFVQAGTNGGTMLERPALCGCSLRLSARVGLVLAGFGL